MLIKGVHVCRHLLPKLLLGGGEKFALISKGNAGVRIPRGSDVVLSSVYRYVSRAMVLYPTERGVPVFQTQCPG